MLAVAIVANLVSYVFSTAPGTVLGTGYDAREIAAVLPLGAVLAGRVFGPWIAGEVLVPSPAPALALALAGGTGAGRGASASAGGTGAGRASAGKRFPGMAGRRRG